MVRTKLVTACPLRHTGGVRAFGLLFSLTGCFSTVQVPVPVGAPLEVRGPGGFPHEHFTELLASVVDGGLVDYRGLADAREPLARYLELLGRISPRSNPELFLTEADRLAYWLNAYNAFVLYGVTERPQMRSVDDEKYRFFYFTRYQLGGSPISLYHLENSIIREEFAEPRIHFALNCASAGCPKLPAEAFVPETLDAQLERETRLFCAREDGVRLAGTEVEVSQIFEWYAKDFEPVGGPIGLCQAHGREDLPPSAPIRFLRWDWTLNHQPGRALFDGPP